MQVEVGCLLLFLFLLIIGHSLIEREQLPVRRARSGTDPRFFVQLASLLVLNFFLFVFRKFFV